MIYAIILIVLYYIFICRHRKWRERGIKNVLDILGSLSLILRGVGSICRHDLSTYRFTAATFVFF